MAWQNWFPRILDMSLTASAVIGFVLLLRLVLKRAPRIFSYALWLVVLFRLLCPVAPEAPVGVLREAETVRHGYGEAIALSGAEKAMYRAAGDAANGGPGAQHTPTAEPDDAGAGGASPLRREVWVQFGQYVWLAGIGGMLLCSAAQYLKLRRRLAGAVRLRDNIWRADHIDTPFVMGVLRPRIFLPSSIAEGERGYVLAHEKHHIRRGDPLWRLLAFAALCLHWFNPLAWLAFALSRKDMEMSCDEAVTREMDGSVRAAYSESLLRFATGRKIAIGAPLAFGESDTKERIVHVMKYKKPKILVTVLAALLCVGAVTVFAFNAEKEASKELTAQEALDTLEASVERDGDHAYFTLPENYTSVENWNIHVAGRMAADDGMSMSMHYFENESWQAGGRYAVKLAGLTELTLVAWLPGADGEQLERGIDLLRGERLPELQTPAASTASWEADLDGDGTAERIVLDVSLLEENAFSVPWIESKDGTKLCELDPIGMPHAGWNTYALLEMDGRTYLFQYNPYMSTGSAGYSYCIWSVGADSGHLKLEGGRSVLFPTYAPMSDEEIDSLAEFVDVVNGYWSYSRLLFTTDKDFVRGLVQDDGRKYVTSAPVICGKAGGPSYVEELPWIIDELTEVGLYQENLGLRDRLKVYQTYAIRRYEQYLKSFDD